MAKIETAEFSISKSPSTLKTTNETKATKCTTCIPLIDKVNATPTTLATPEIKPDQVVDAKTKNASIQQAFL